MVGLNVRGVHEVNIHRTATADHISATKLVEVREATHQNGPNASTDIGHPMYMVGGLQLF